jgi:hypothetical protein
MVEEVWNELILTARTRNLSFARRGRSHGLPFR